MARLNKRFTPHVLKLLGPASEALWMTEGLGTRQSAARRPDPRHQNRDPADAHAAPNDYFEDSAAAANSGCVAMRISRIADRYSSPRWANSLERSSKSSTSSIRRNTSVFSETGISSNARE